MLDPLSFTLLLNRRFRRFPAEIMKKMYEAYVALMIELQIIAETRALYFERLRMADWFEQNLDPYIGYRKFGPGF